MTGLSIPLPSGGVEGGLISPKQIAGVDLFLYIVEDGVVTVGDDGMRLGLELCEVVDDTAAKECGAIGECGLVDDDRSSLGLDAFHNSLNAALTEIVGVGLHRQTVDADNRRPTPTPSRAELAPP